MLNSVINLFNQYIDNTTRYTIHSINMERGENPEDIYYICAIDRKFYIVLETDYINSLVDVLTEIREKAAVHNLSPLNWLIKKESMDKKDSKVSVESMNDIEDMRDVLVYKSADTYTRYIIIELRSEVERKQKYRPGTYSGT